MTETAKDIAALLALLLAACLLNIGLAEGYWRWDDPQTLLHLHRFPILDDFLRPEIWQQFSPANLTPWLMVSFEVDLILFGLEPAAFYRHQLLALLAVIIALYACQRQWLSSGYALAGTALFLAGAPVVYVSEQLMTRHYLEGLLFCLLALYFFVRSLRQGGRVAIAASVLFYALAVTAKEIYVPLVVLLPFLPVGTLRQRALRVLPFVLVALAYTLWRGYMLDSVSGGYVQSSEYLSAAFLGEVLASFMGFPALLFGSFWPAFVLLYLLLLGSYVVVCRSRLLLSALIVLLVVVPLVPLVRSPGILAPDRYLLLLWTVLCFSVAFYAQQLQRALSDAGRLSPVVAIGCSLPVLLSVALVHAVHTRQAVRAVAAEFDTQGRFIWANGDDVALLPSPNLLSSFWYVRGLEDLKSRLGSGSGSPLPIVDEIYLSADLTILMAWDAGCACLQDISADVARRIEQHQARLREDAPLQLHFAYQDGYFSWNFGPYADGDYHVVSKVIGVLPAPREGRLRVTLEEDAPFYLRYTSPEGWVSYSNLQRIRHNAAAVNWSRE